MLAWRLWGRPQKSGLLASRAAQNAAHVIESFSFPRRASLPHICTRQDAIIENPVGSRLLE